MARNGGGGVVFTQVDAEKALPANGEFVARLFFFLSFPDFFFSRFDT